MKFEIYSKYENGKLANSKAVKKAFEQLSGKAIKITIEPKRKQRSNDQNAYIHGYLFPKLQEGFIDLGWDVSVSWVKERMKRMFLTFETYNEKTGEYVENQKGTSECTTTEMTVFIEKCIRFGAEEMGIIVAYPNESI